MASKRWAKATVQVTIALPDDVDADGVDDVVHAVWEAGDPLDQYDATLWTTDVQVVEQEKRP